MSIFLTAHRIHDGTRFLPEGYVLEVEQDGTIVAVHDENDGQDVRRYDGVLCPGFINAHCHLELSHLHGAVPRGTRLPTFLEAVVRNRGRASTEEKAAAREEAYNALLAGGVVALGDVANTTDTLEQRARGNLHIHTFVEALGYDERRAEARFGAAAEVYTAFAAQEGRSTLRQSIVPHAPYSVSDELFARINAHDPGAILSIHTAEHAEEVTLLSEGRGAVADMLRRMGLAGDRISPKAASVAAFLAARLASTHPIVFVHNTYVTAADVRTASAHFSRAYWCLCPGANLYIEGRLPDVPMLVKSGVPICLGTDSLASNDSLSILAEMQRLNVVFPEIGWAPLLCWATLGGAEALGMDAFLGSFSLGKRPGVLHLQGLEEASASVSRLF